MYVEQVARNLIFKTKTISNLHLRAFINFNVQNVSSLIDMYNDLFILRVVLVSCYGINTLFNLTQYLKIRNKIINRSHT